MRSSAKTWPLKQIICIKKIRHPVHAFFVLIVLSAARAALLTGRLPIRNGFYTTNAHARNGANISAASPGNAFSSFILCLFAWQQAWLNIGIWLCALPSWVFQEVHFQSGNKGVACGSTAVNKNRCEVCCFLHMMLERKDIAKCSH